MKCKDCIHYAAHKHFYFGEEDFDEYFNDDNVESQCPEFEDKKEWLKLPCKVGDTLYMPWQWNGTSAIAQLKVLRVEYSEYEFYVETDFETDDYDYYKKYQRGHFIFENFGKMVFLTREAAEKALAERSGKQNEQMH